MATERDYYTILGVSRTASDAEIKRAFRKLAQQWHPDVNRDSGADERFKEINEAYQVLSDPQRRQAYDMFGVAGVNGSAGFDGSQQGFGGFSDIFDAFFGGTAAGGGGARRGVGRRLRPPLRPEGDLRGVDPGHREGDRVPGPRSLCDLLGIGREARLVGEHLPAVPGPRRVATCARPCWARWSTS